MIIVTGQFRSGTSMMMRCLLSAGFKKGYEGGENTSERYPYGFFEGKLLNCGVAKSFKYENFHTFNNLKIILMTRDEEQIKKSEIEKQVPKIAPQVDKEKLHNEVKKYPHIVVDYETFIHTPDVYKEQFINLLGDIDFEKLKSGIDKTLFIKR